MDIYLISFLVLVTTVLLYGISAGGKRQSITVMADGDKVRRAAHHTKIVSQIDGVRTLLESWRYVQTLCSLLSFTTYN